MDLRPFATLPDGRAVERVDLSAGSVSASILTYGGIIASVNVPDHDGRVADVTLGFDDLSGWLHDPQYFGAIVGRFANRIRGGRFRFDGREVTVTANRGGHHLHGGDIGFDKAVWQAEPTSSDDSVGVVLRHHSPDGDEGFPGALDVDVTYALDTTGALTIHYRAVADSPTVVNLTNHVYLNLAGGGTIHDHVVHLDASSFLAIGDGTLPTGEVRPVDGTPMDFRSPHPIGARMDADDEQLRLAGGYDHCFVVDGSAGTLRPCASVTAAGRRLDVSTTQPGFQLYSGHGIRPRSGRDGAAYGPHSGFCIETQHFPDAPNHPHFPSTRLGPGEVLDETTVYRFGPA